MVPWEVFPLLLNIASTVSIVGVNKSVLLAYPYAMGLTSAHTIVSAIIIIGQSLRCRPEKTLTVLEDVWIAILTIGSIYFNNQSLRINTVTLYQLSKLLNIPFMCFLQFVQNGKRHPLAIYMTLVILTFGVALSTLHEINVTSSSLGLIMCVLAIVVTVVDQMECGRLKAKRQLSAVEFVHSNILQRIVVCLIVVALTEKDAILKADEVPAGVWLNLFLTCLFATAINLTSVAIIGKFGSLTLQVVGHAKTMLILALGMVWNQPSLDIHLFRQLVGIAIAMGAAIRYGQLISSPEAASPRANKVTYVIVALLASSFLIAAFMWVSKDRMPDVLDNGKLVHSLFLSPREGTGSSETAETQP